MIDWHADSYSKEDLHAMSGLFVPTSYRTQKLHCQAAIQFPASVMLVMLAGAGGNTSLKLQNLLWRVLQKANLLSDCLTEGHAGRERLILVSNCLIKSHRGREY